MSKFECKKSNRQYLALLVASMQIVGGLAPSRHGGLGDNFFGYGSHALPALLPSPRYKIFFKFFLLQRVCVHSRTQVPRRLLVEMYYSVYRRYYMSRFYRR